MICSAQAIVDLVRDNPLPDETRADIEAHVTVGARTPANWPKLPIYAPSEESWELEVVRVVGPAQSDTPATERALLPE
jgi:hypothetical protein